MRRLVVVGASLAGLRAAQAARGAGFAGEIVMVGEEPHAPYNRPPLSKELLAGRASSDTLTFPRGSVKVQWRLGIKAVGVDRSSRTVLLADGDQVRYDRLIVATGCRARLWSGPGAGLNGVHVLRDLDDAVALNSSLERAARLVVLGAGFIGCEVAATARERGLEVTLVDVATTPMQTLGPRLGVWCAQLHRDQGVDLRLGAGVRALLGENRVRAVELDDGSRLDADLVVLGLGAIPNTEWLAGSGLRLGSGLMCDATLTAIGDPDILAAGDVVSWPHPLAGGDTVRVEHWTVASEQGHLAGRNALLPPAERSPHLSPPYFWSDQYDVKIQAAGLPALAAELEILESSRGGSRFVCAGERDGRLIGVVAVNAARRLGWYRRLLVEAPALDEVRSAVTSSPDALGALVGAS